MGWSVPFSLGEFLIEGPLLLRVVRYLPFVTEHAIPVRFEGRRRTSPKGGNRGSVPVRSEAVLRYAHLAPEKLSSVAGRIERQASRLIGEAPRGANVAKKATFSLCSLN